MILGSFLDLLLGWLTVLPPTVGLLLFAFIIVLLTTLAFKYFSDQKEMKRLRDEMKELSKEMKSHRNDLKKVKELQKKLFKLQAQYSRHSWKVNFYTLIPVVILFSWLNAHFAYQPLKPNQPFNLTLVFDSPVTLSEVNIKYPSGLILLNASVKESTPKELIFTFKGEKGDYNLSIIYRNQTFLKEVKISDKQEYASVDKKIKGGELKRIRLSNKPMRINLGIRMHWIFAYMIFSMILSPLIRKILKVY